MPHLDTWLEGMAPIWVPAPLEEDKGLIGTSLWELGASLCNFKELPFIMPFMLLGDNPVAIVSISWSRNRVIS